MNWNATWPESAIRNVPATIRQGRILNCPSGAPFLNTLAQAVLSGEIWDAKPPAQHELPALTVYVPTRSAVEPLKLAFLSLAPKRATFLPRIRILGEVDPIDSFAAFGSKIASGEVAIQLLKHATEVPPAFGGLERQLLLSSFVLQASRKFRSTKLAPGEQLFVDISPANAFTIAGRIGSLIDEAQSEGTDLERVHMLSADDASSNEQLSFRLLRSVLKDWRAQKVRNGKIDAEERRTALMFLDAEFIRQSAAPVIVAGSTGTVAATFSLMEAVLTRKGNAIVLPGLDRHLDDDSWARLAEHPEHPQHALQQLLLRLKSSRTDVEELETLKPNAVGRASFLSEAMRPASSTKHWHDFLNCGAEAASPDHLSIIELESIQQEAEVISLILRETLEKPRQTAALVTPDDKLTQRVRHNLARWEISADAMDTAGSAGLFEARVAACAATGKAADLVTLLRHAPGASSVSIRRYAELIELGALRQIWKPHLSKDLPTALSRAAHAVSTGETRHPAMKRVRQDEWEAARGFTGELLDAFAPLEENAGYSFPLADCLFAHREVLSRLTKLGIAIGNEDDDKSTSLLNTLANLDLPGISLDLAGYAALLAELVGTSNINSLPNPHPRLFFWRPLDARLLTADVIVLAGLNEGCWPQNLEVDPWLSRRDRVFVGLSLPERRTGQAAHDFASLAGSADRVYLTRSKTVNGSLARPSRWLSRIKTLASGSPQSATLDNESLWTAWARLQRQPENVTPEKCPEPRPPLAVRPRRLSVTAMETWFANPYAIYARHILGLEPLRELGKGSDARDRGILVHGALHGFMERHKASLPANAAEQLLNEFDKTANAAGFDIASVPFWRTRFERFARWFADTESARRKDVSLLKSEVGGKLSLAGPAGPFEITARADRIDVLSDGSLRIYDFKTSANTAHQALRRDAPQLSLEGLIAREGAFSGIPLGGKSELTYIVATGGEPPGEVKSLKGSAEQAIQNAYVGALNLVALFDDPSTPYRYGTRAIFKDKAENDPYAHLARVREWTVSGVDEGDIDE